MRCTIAATAAMTLAAGLLGTSPALASAPGQAVSARPAGEKLDVHRKYLKCTSPKGKRFNISWSPGVSSTTFYFNNHCKETHRIRVWYSSNGMKCRAITVKPGISGKKKLRRIYYNNLMEVNFGKCPYWP